MGRTVLHAVDVAAGEDEVYRAITTREGLSAFWTKETEAEPVEGSVATFGFPTAPTPARMRVDALERGRRVAWTSLTEWPWWNDTAVSWELSESPEGAGTRVLFRHEFPDDYPDGEFGMVNFVWGQVVGRLKGYVESGERQPFFG